ncbi:protein ECERIFERUM 26-like [Impatiens glandulifera]|uniref:protein ECERIFERUM 26-like n=1 Tax=Impatiens glandulifera TaxID=253017 RepID=UPI001FB160DC|nr:protein ECERIFERUM 26-like [Impatiens glandulifera]
MVSEDLIYGMKLSSVGPGRVSGQDRTHEPTNMDLAMKLHYLRGVYYFNESAFEGVKVQNLKDPMFTWFNHFYTTCGRFRRDESTGRPYIKCNDCGVRFIEAKCTKTLDEWFLIKSNDASIEKLLVSNQVLGPQLVFSPLILVQFTWFRCGGVSLGLSWAHVIGDAFAAIDCMNAWGRVTMSIPLTTLNEPQNHIRSNPSKSPLEQPVEPLSARRVVSPVGDHWIIANKGEMKMFSLRITSQQLSDLKSRVSDLKGNNPLPPFESLCAIIWKCVGQVRNGPGPNLVTICRNDPSKRKTGILSNGQSIRIVKAHYDISEAHPGELALLLLNQSNDERYLIEESMERGKGTTDFIVYGANLTFVDLVDADLYGLETRGHRPISANYFIDGVGDDGSVLVLPGPRDGEGGVVVNAVFPEAYIWELRSELKKEWSIC